MRAAWSAPQLRSRSRAGGEVRGHVPQPHATTQRRSELVCGAGDAEHLLDLLALLQLVDWMAWRLRLAGDGVGRLEQEGGVVAADQAAMTCRSTGSGGSVVRLAQITLLCELDPLLKEERRSCWGG